MSEPSNIILVQLRSLRELVERLQADHVVLERRFDSIRQAVNGESFLGRIAAAEIEEQLIAINARLDALDAKR